MLERLFICLLYLQFSILSTYDFIFICIFLSYFHFISIRKKHPITLECQMKILDELHAYQEQLSFDELNDKEDLAS